MAIGDSDEQTVRETLAKLDRAHADYVRQFYGANIHNCTLYHLVIDSTAIELEGCVEIIARAAEALPRTGAS
jgi:cytidylate kinase